MLFIYLHIFMAFAYVVVSKRTDSCMHAPCGALAVVLQVIVTSSHRYKNRANPSSESYSTQSETSLFYKA